MNIKEIISVMCNKKLYTFNCKNFLIGKKIHRQTCIFIILIYYINTIMLLSL